MYAQVVVGLPVEGPFDYLVPDELSDTIQPGMRVKVSFGFKNMLGYVVGLSKKSSIAKVKPLRGCGDEIPLFDSYFLRLAKELSRYYCCSWGEALETMLPAGLRRGARLKEGSPNPIAGPCAGKTQAEGKKILVYDPEGIQRWDYYFSCIRKTLDMKACAILLVAESASLEKVRQRIQEEVKCDVALLHRRLRAEVDQWISLKRGFTGVVVGTRSAVFAPLNNLGLIIVDEEQDSSYKQDQVPHYHCREVAWWRAEEESADLVLGSSSPSIESMYLVKKGKLIVERILRKRAFPEIKTLQTLSGFYSKKSASFISQYFIDAIARTLENKGKILLFLNRTGYATAATCQTCLATLQCPRCEQNLVYHFKEKKLLCHYCNFSMIPPSICPKCNGGYIKYAGYGTEKIESELCRIFPYAKIMHLDSGNALTDADSNVFIATRSIFKKPHGQFDLIGILGVDNAINRVDFRATEKTFNLLLGLCALTDKVVIIQTSLSGHYCFKALLLKDEQIFYDEELSRRRQLRFPPFAHLGAVKLRSKIQQKTQDAAFRLFGHLQQRQPKGIAVISCHEGQPAKLRGHYYWQILTSSTDAEKLCSFIKMCLKEFAHSGIIVTVDIDPQ